MNLYNNPIDEAIFTHTPVVPAPIHGELLPCDNDHYRFVTANEGIYLQAESHLFSISVLLCPIAYGHFPFGQVREYIRLKHGKIPFGLFEQMREDAMVKAPVESAGLIIWNDEQQCYQYIVPEVISASSGHISYFNHYDNIILDCHSHGYAKAGFSPQDDQDDTFANIYMASVFGQLRERSKATILNRLVVYGHFVYVSDLMEFFDFSDQM